MATFAVGDVHGNVAALEDVLQQLRAQVTKGDVVVFLGDYIDRGAGTRGCIDAILAFRDAVAAETVCLRGNHEDWMLRTMNDFNRHSWLLGMEAMTTIRSYSTEAEQALRDALGAAGLQLYLGKCALPYDKFFEAMPAAHRAFLAQLALSIETADLYLHARRRRSVNRVSSRSAGLVADLGARHVSQRLSRSNVGCLWPSQQCCGG